MGEENNVVYDDEVAKRNIREGNFKDHDGNKIGTIENLGESFYDVMVDINTGIWMLKIEKNMDALNIEKNMYNYLATRYCYKGDTLGKDTCLNDFMSRFSNLNNVIEYKLIN